MELKNNKKEQEQIIDTMENLGFTYDWSEIEDMDDYFDGYKIIIEGGYGTLFLDIEKDTITYVDYLPFGKRVSYWIKEDK